METNDCRHPCLVPIRPGENSREFYPLFSVSIRLKIYGTAQHAHANSVVDSQLCRSSSLGAFDPRKVRQKISDLLFLSRQRSHRLATPLCRLYFSPWLLSGFLLVHVILSC